jgi:SAM-dependent methyltransferase
MRYLRLLPLWIERTRHAYGDLTRAMADPDRPISGLNSPWTELLSRVRRDGALQTMRKGAQYIFHRQSLFDQTHGTNTGRIEPLWRLNIKSDNLRFGIRYETTGEREIERAIQLLPLHYNEFTFIDLGCGKGLPLLVADRLGFHEAIGVDFAPELTSIARKNATLVGAKNVKVIDSDAASFQFPDGKLVVFLFNPFGDAVMAQVLENLGHRVASSVEPVYFIYVNPGCPTLFYQCTFLTVYATAPGKNRVTIYKSVEFPAPSGPAH